MLSCKWLIEIIYDNQQKENNMSDVNVLDNTAATWQQNIDVIQGVTHRSFKGKVDDQTMNAYLKKIDILKRLETTTASASLYC